MQAHAGPLRWIRVDLSLPAGCSLNPDSQQLGTPLISTPRSSMLPHTPPLSSCVFSLEPTPSHEMLLTLTPISAADAPQTPHSHSQPLPHYEESVPFRMSVDTH